MRNLLREILEGTEKEKFKGEGFITVYAQEVAFKVILIWLPLSSHCVQ